MNSNPVPVLLLRRAPDGVWEVVIEEVRGGDDVLVRGDLEEAHGTRTPVRVAGELKDLVVFVDPDGTAVVRYADALPG